MNKHRLTFWRVCGVTAILAQAGIWILAALVWAAIFQNDFIFFSYHPLLNSAATLLFVQGTLVLQPTASQKDKMRGSYAHSVFNTLGVAGTFIFSSTLGVLASKRGQGDISRACVLCC